MVNNWMGASPITARSSTSAILTKRTKIIPETRFIPEGKYAIVKTLQGKIFVDNSLVPVLTQFSPGERVPSITLSVGAGMGEMGRATKTEYQVLPSDHPYYNSEDPTAEYPYREVTTMWSKESISVHVWGRTPDERDYIYGSVKKLFDLALRSHYSGCMNYVPANGTCNVTDDYCDALGIVNEYSIKGMCPYSEVTDETSPNYRNPMSHIRNQGIYNMTKFSAPQLIEETDSFPELYRAVLDINYEIERSSSVEVMPIYDVEFPGDEILITNVQEVRE